MNIRDISKGELGINLSKKPRYKSSVTLDTLGRPYYKRFSFNKIFTIINPTNKNVASVRKYHEKEVRRKIRKYEKINDSTISFLKTHIDNLTDFLPLTEDSQFDLIHAVEDKFVIPLANALTENCAIDEELLKIAERVIDDLNDDFDIDDFNERTKCMF